MSKLNIIQHDDPLCHDSRYSHITYCRNYDTKDCLQICYYARKMNFLKQGLELQVAEEMATGGKYGEN